MRYFIFLFLCLGLSAAQIPISGLPAAGSANGTDELPANQGGTTRKVTVSQIRAGTGIPSDLGYDSTWNGVAATAPSKNSIYDFLHLFDTNDDGFVEGFRVFFTDPDGKWTATDVNAALAELNDVINGGVPNSAAAKVDYSQLFNFPADLLDGDQVGTDPSALHDDVPGEIAAIADKATPTTSDHLLINDAAAGNAPKDITIGSLEPTLEGVMDLQDLQGAVTDGQVPNNITVDQATVALSANAVAWPNVTGKPDPILIGGNGMTNNLPLVGAGGAVAVATNVINPDVVNAEAINLGPSATIPAAKIAFSDPGANYVSTDIDNAINELASNNVSGPNASDGKVSWDQLVNVPAGFADGADNSSPGGAYSAVSEEGTPVTARTNVNFIGATFTVTDNAGQNRTDVTADADVEDLADGSLSGGKVGAGIEPENITGSGTIITNAMDPLVALTQGQLGGTGQAPDVRGLRETGGPTLLTLGAVADGQVLTRSGSSIVGAASGGSADYTVDINGSGGSNVYTNSPATNTTFLLSAVVLAGGSTNHATYETRMGGYRLEAAPVIINQSNSFWGASATTLLQTNVLWQVSGNTIVLTAWGVTNGAEETHWQASDVVAKSTTNMIATAPPAPTYLIAQDFEGTGYDNSETWTESGTGTTDEDYTGVVLAGAQSVRFQPGGGTAETLSPTHAAKTEVWGYAMVRWVTANAANRTFIRIRSSTSAISEIRRNSDGTLRISHGGATASTVGTVSAGTTYHVWWRFNDDSGPDDGVAEIAFSTDTTKPTGGNNFASLSTGTSTQDADNILIGALVSGSTEDLVMDKIRVDDVEIGSNPQ